MKLVTTDQSALMDITSVRVIEKSVVVTGVIMGAMPIQAVLSGTEMRKGFAMLGFGTLWKILAIFVRGRGA